VLGFWLIGLPASLWFGFALGGGAAGLWWGLVVGLIVVAVSLLMRVRQRMRRSLARVSVDGAPAPV
jgi:MATE family multidrug resistance protein